MNQKLIRKVLQIEGMTCSNCEVIIENALSKVDGIIEIKAKYKSSTIYITYDDNLISLNQIIDHIENIGYEVITSQENQIASPSKPKKSKEELSTSDFLGIGIIIFSIYIIISNTIGFNFIPEVNPSMGYGVLFIVGLITSLHCLTMCGGINLSSCISYNKVNDSSDKFAKFKPSFLYNSGRVVSYTLIGGIVGALGSVISFPGPAKGLVAIISGLLMIVMGLNMLNVFPWLRKFNPRMPKFFASKIHNSDKESGPFYIGLLNGLMPCGPLQAMQLYALGTGSFLTGALSMFFFSLGTVPLMFGLGAVSSLLSRKFTHKMMKVSAALVIVLGFIMADRGLALSGISSSSEAFNPITVTQTTEKAVIDGDIQRVTTSLASGRYEPITVQKGVPVIWTITAESSDINGCNNALIIPEFSKELQLKPGENVIEFTPTKSGTFEYSCWMGMITSKIVVVDNISNVSEAEINNVETIENEAPLSCH
ncbi:urease accessory protein UreH domain-containing protein [Acetoanaerobium noterae]|uniref:urease accessory protein UreH domain-containing protein n=1 Tax=Acetoanaerobium noterae TaxID=745369 RepID=UPI0032426FDF